ncbi:MAG: hypothetical protein KBF66_14570 [Rhodoferax sp.]|uniref:hypothetical protein n=1 Tax=Rhodoferax sp. TaxID=50421 RepID=UPI001B3F621F|nr:hypothetical protein [Rhodoferax sp.]MBP9906777.1 hypothetical protein [Rhodoferax sp.]
MQNTDANATLRAQLQHAEDKLSVSYQFSNYCNSDIFLFNKMYDDVDDEGRYKVDQNLCIIEIQNGNTVISKKIATLPETLLVEALNIPCITVVGPGNSFHETLVLNLPLQAWSPYESASASNRLDLPVLFQLGYVVGQASSKSVARTVSTTNGKALRFAAVTIASQNLLTAGPFQTVSIGSP